MDAKEKGRARNMCSPISQGATLHDPRWLFKEEGGGYEIGAAPERIPSETAIVRKETARGIYRPTWELR